MSYSNDRAAFASALEAAVTLLEPHGPSTDLAMAYCSYAFLLSIRDDMTKRRAIRTGDEDGRSAWRTER
jgi:hypothetical protein